MLHSGAVDRNENGGILHGVPCSNELTITKDHEYDEIMQCGGGYVWVYLQNLSCRGYALCNCRKTQHIFTCSRLNGCKTLYYFW